MQRKTRRRTGPVALAVAVLLSTAGLAGCHRRAPREADFELVDKVATWKLDQLLDRIDATPAQRKEFHAAKDWLLDEIQYMARQRKARHGEILVEFMRDDPDPELLHDMLDTRIREHQAFAHDVLDTILHLHAQLTPEQRQALIEIVQKRIADHHDHGFGPTWAGTDSSGFGRSRDGHRHGRIKEFLKKHFGRLAGRSDD